jgi:GntR family transcriptional regulator
VAEKRRRLPKYYRISRDIIGRIQRRSLVPGAQVPSENEIIERYKVSNTTARKALLEIERAGWATRIKGKGTYVREDRVNRSATRILGFTRNMLEAGRTPSTRVLSCRRVRGDRSLTLNRRTYTLRGPYWELVRLRHADGVPLLKEVRLIAAQFCPDMDGKDLAGSLYELYEGAYGIQLTEIHQRLSAVVLEGRDLDTFALEAPIPAFRVEGVTFCGTELVLEIEDSLYRGDQYWFSVKATP